MIPIFPIFTQYHAARSVFRLAHQSRVLIVLIPIGRYAIPRLSDINELAGILKAIRGRDSDTDARPGKGRCQMFGH